MSFIEAVAKATGKKQRIPAHWLDHPTIGKQFRLPPSAEAKAAKQDEKPAAKKAEPKKADS